MCSVSKDTILKLALLCMGMLAVVTAHTLIGRLWLPKSVVAPMKVRLDVSMPCHSCNKIDLRHIHCTFVSPLCNPR